MNAVGYQGIFEAAGHKLKRYRRSYALETKFSISQRCMAGLRLVSDAKCRILFHAECL